MDLSGLKLDKKCRKFPRPRLLGTWDWFSIVVASLLPAIPLTITIFFLNYSKLANQGQLVYIVSMLILAMIGAGYQQARPIISMRVKLSEGELLPLDQLIQVILKDTVAEAMFISGAISSGNSHPTSHLRANIMLTSCANEELHIVASHNMPAGPERELVWTRGHGACGIAWDDKKQLSVDLTIAVPTGGPDWRYPTDDHRKYTSKLSSLHCAPIYAPSGAREVIGVLSVDSTHPMSTTRLNSEEMFAKMQEQANILSKPLFDYVTKYRN